MRKNNYIKAGVLAGSEVLLVAAFFLASPRPPGNLIRAQLDPEHAPVGSRVIRDKTYGESWQVRANGGGNSRSGIVHFKPRRIRITCDSPINASLIDLSSITMNELAALNTHPRARHAGLNPKPLSEYPKICESNGEKQIDWQLHEGMFGNCLYHLIFDCPQNPHAVVEIRVDYGGKGYDNAP